ncbi:serine/threonine-protein kinase [Clostridium oceanicum]|uniref:Protein kinase n=1 Tax=Clostridium oceanicum TaxID=1543 RepID=A0ABP3UJD5_9CLOT
MYKDNSYYIDLNNKAENLIRKGEFLGSGHNGIVYMLPKNRVIKIFKDMKVCEQEYTILKRAGKNKSKYFPKVYDRGSYYIVREYVGGKRLDKYIKRNGINKKITHNIIKLIREFKRIGFNKLDIRCKDLYVNEKFSLRVIDPKNNYSKKMEYPRHLMKGLNNLGALEDFLETVKDEAPKEYNFWSERIEQYLKYGIK